MNIMDLCGTWSGQCIGPDGTDFDFVGTVPGSAIQDLIDADRLPKDLFRRDHADKVVDCERCDYVYRKHFSLCGAHERATLRFERIDTYADVYLNGIKIYHSENGNVRHDIDVTDGVRQGENTLEVRLYSPVEWVKDLPLRKGAFTRERMNTRRMQCTYGWDWVARFVTCGLGECSLLLSGENDFVIPAESVYVATLDADSESATVRVDLNLSAPYEGRILDFAVSDEMGAVVCRLSKYCKENFVRLDLDIPRPALWYPAGYGAQPLYILQIADGDRCVYSEKFGIRTVKIMQLPDRVGSANPALCLSVKNPEYDRNEAFSGFVLKINGERIFCQGANWVPCVPFGCGDVKARQTEILELCASAGINMLRVWGGGAFESRHFYDECSRLGILVTQDFLMACGAYPEEEDWFIAELQREASYVVRLCRNQPCLVWWSGDNENAVNGCDTDEDYRGRRSAYEGIAPVLYREDPYRRFLPSSPFGGRLYASNTVGTTHNTQFLGSFFKYLMRDDLSDYKDELKKYRARFIAEEPQLGVASLPSLRRFMSDADIFEGEEMWRYHTKNNPGLKLTLFDYLLLITEKILGPFQAANPHDKLFKLQYMQYEWIRVVMEQAKREREFCAGIIFWMMNDCWPAAAGWALIDYYNLPKNAFYAFKRCAKPVIASVDYADDCYRVYVINDSAEKQARVDIKILSADRKTVKDYKAVTCCIPKHTSLCVLEARELLATGEVLICDVVSDTAKDRAFYCHGGLKIDPVDVDFSVDPEKAEITVTAGAQYIHAVTVSGNAVFADNCFSLLPHESRRVPYRALAAGKSSDFTVEAYTLA